MKNFDFQEAVKSLVWIAASYYPLHTFYGASIWQVVAVFATMVAATILSATIFGFLLALAIGPSRENILPPIPNKVVGYICGLIAAFMSFHFAMACVLSNTNPIENTLVLLTALTASSIVGSGLKLTTNRLAFA